MPARRPSAAGSIEQSQKQLYLAILRELAPFEKLKRRELTDYERSYREGMPRKLRASTRGALLSAIERARVVLVGDFHPFRQSQKGFIRILEGAISKRTRPVIALECFSQRHQASLDHFRAGLITAEELRDKTNFDESWPFPWENYREILRLARSAKLPLLALNVPGKLHARDVAAAARIAERLRAQSDTTIFALFGELHLGRSHLPKTLRAAIGASVPITVIHQNDPALYWRTPTLPNGEKAEVIQLGVNEFCIQNSVPWVKLRSYLDWLEGSPTPDFDDDNFDAPGLVHHYAKLLAHTTGLPDALDQSMEVLPPDRLSRRSPLLHDLRSPDAELFSHALRFRRTGYLPQRGVLALSAVGTNALLEAATFLLRRSLKPTLPTKQLWGVDEFVSHFFFAYLGSKLLNPKRKCDEVADLRRRALARDATAKRALFLLAPHLKGEKRAARAPRLSASRELEAARAAGFVLAERTFQALLQNADALDQVRKLLRSAEPRKLLREVARGIRQARVAPASKGEKF